jgi:hypothetical protein
MKNKIIWSSMFMGLIIANGFCLKPTDNPIAEPTSVTDFTNVDFKKYALGYASPTGQIDITVIKSNGATGMKSIYFTQKSKKIEYILAKLMNTYSGPSNTSLNTEKITLFKNNANEIIGIKFIANRSWGNSHYWFGSIAFFTVSGVDYVNIVLYEDMNNPITYSFNIDDQDNALDLDYAVGQFILLPCGTNDEHKTYHLEVRGLYSPFRFEFDWSQARIPPQRIQSGLDGD